MIHDPVTSLSLLRIDDAFKSSQTGCCKLKLKGADGKELTSSDIAKYNMMLNELLIMQDMTDPYGFVWLSWVASLHAALENGPRDSIFENIAEIEHIISKKMAKQTHGTEVVDGQRAHVWSVQDAARHRDTGVITISYPQTVRTPPGQERETGRLRGVKLAELERMDLAKAVQRCRTSGEAVWHDGCEHPTRDGLWNKAGGVFPYLQDESTVVVHVSDDTRLGIMDEEGSNIEVACRLLLGKVTSIEIDDDPKQQIAITKLLDKRKKKIGSVGALQGNNRFWMLAEALCGKSRSHIRVHDQAAWRVIKTLALLYDSLYEFLETPISRWQMGRCNGGGSFRANQSKDRSASKQNQGVNYLGVLKGLRRARVRYSQLHRNSYVEVVTEVPHESKIVQAVVSSLISTERLWHFIMLARRNEVNQLRLEDIFVQNMYSAPIYLDDDRHQVIAMIEYVLRKYWHGNNAFAASLRNYRNFGNDHAEANDETDSNNLQRPQIADGPSLKQKMEAMKVMCGRAGELRITLNSMKVFRILSESAVGMRRVGMDIRSMDAMLSFVENLENERGSPMQMVRSNWLEIPPGPCFLGDQTMNIGKVDLVRGLQGEMRRELDDSLAWLQSGLRIIVGNNVPIAKVENRNICIVYVMQQKITHTDRHAGCSCRLVFVDDIPRLMERREGSFSASQFYQVILNFEGTGNSTNPHLIAIRPADFEQVTRGIVPISESIFFHGNTVDENVSTRMEEFCRENDFSNYKEDYEQYYLTRPDPCQSRNQHLIEEVMIRRSDGRNTQSARMRNETLLSQGGRNSLSAQSVPQTPSDLADSIAGKALIPSGGQSGGSQLSTISSAPNHEPRLPLTFQQWIDEGVVFTHFSKGWDPHSRTLTDAPEWFRTMADRWIEPWHGVAPTQANEKSL